MENIIQKLSLIKTAEKIYDNWSLEEIKNVLELYYIICKKEKNLLDLVYNYHGDDFYEDIFRDYSENYINAKADGVKEALEVVNDELK